MIRNTQTTTRKTFVRDLFQFCMMGLFLALLISCSGSSGDNSPLGPVFMGQLPKLLSNTANNGSLRADLSVYGPDGSLQHSEDLEINPTTGEVFSQQFELPRGFTFSFVITFYYTEGAFGELPIAFVAKVEDTEENFLSVIWDESEVMVSQNQIDPSISASLSTTNLPDLDADDDGFSNFAEIREGSDPTDPNSGPQAPQMGVPNIPVKDDFIELTVDFSDASGVNTIKPTGAFTCGYFEWEVEVLDPEGLTKRLKAKFNLHAHASIVDNGKVDLQFLVNDVLGVSASYIITIEGVGKNTLAPSDPLNQPAINIITPGDGEIINSDFFSVDSEACDEDPLIDFSLINIAGFSDADGNIERVAGTLNSGTLGDSQVLTFEATDDQGNTKTQSITVNIDTNNPIKVDAPTPGSTISDGFTVAAHVDKNLMQDVTQFFIEKITTTSEPYAEIFELNQLKFDVNSLPEAFTGQVFDVSQVGVGEFLIWFVAIGPDSGRIELPVKFFLNIKPIIERFEVLQKGPEVCLIDGNIELGWKVANLGNDGEVKLEGQFVDANDTTLGNPDLSGPIPCQDSVLLEATRFVLDQSTGNNDIPIDADPSILSLTRLRVKSYPQDGVTPGNFLVEFEEVGGSSYNFSSLYWEVKLNNLDSGSTVFRTGSGGQIDNGDLNLNDRTGYEITLSLLSGPGGVVISTGQPFYFVTGDQNLIGYYRMDNQYLDGSGISIGKDYSGNDNDGLPISLVAPPLVGGDACILNDCAGFSKISNSQIFIGDIIPALSPFTIEGWFYWDGNVGGILSQGQEFSLTIEDNSGKKLIFYAWDNVLNERKAQLDINSSPINHWYYFAIIYHPSDPNKEVKIFLNDGNNSQENFDGLANPINNIGNSLRLGVDYFGVFNDFALDEISIFNAAIVPPPGF